MYNKNTKNMVFIYYNFINKNQQNSLYFSLLFRFSGHGGD